MDRTAPALAERGDRVITTDELTGVPALERKHPGVPLAPGQVERRAFAYIRPGTCAGSRSRDGVTGHGIAPSLGPTRTEADVLAHVHGVGATDLQAGQWHGVVDKLNIHPSEAVVRWVAEESDLDVDRGEQGKRGVLHTQQSRAAFLRDPTHRIVFHSTPKQCSWLHQLEIGLRMLVRKLIKRGSFSSVDDVTANVVHCIDDSNRTMATPFTWTDQGKPLMA